MKFIAHFTVVAESNRSIADIDDDRMADALMEQANVTAVHGHGVKDIEDELAKLDLLWEALDDAASNLDDNEYHADGDPDEEDDQAKVKRWRQMRDQIDRQREDLR